VGTKLEFDNVLDGVGRDLEEDEDEEEDIDLSEEL